MDYFTESYSQMRGYDYESVTFQINNKLKSLKLTDDDIITIEFSRHYYDNNGSYGGKDQYTLTARVFYKTRDKEEYKTIVKD